MGKLELLLVFIDTDSLYVPECWYMMHVSESDVFTSVLLIAVLDI